MADPEQTDNETVEETTQGSAGAPQRISQLLGFTALAAEPEPSTAELIARQAEKGETRKGGPPLPEGEPTEAVARAETAAEADEPTEAAEPRPQDC